MHHNGEYGFASARIGRINIGDGRASPRMGNDTLDWTHVAALADARGWRHVCVAILHEANHLKAGPTWA